MNMYTFTIYTQREYTQSLHLHVQIYMYTFTNYTQRVYTQRVFTHNVYTFSIVFVQEDCLHHL